MTGVVVLAIGGVHFAARLPVGIGDAWRQHGLGPARVADLGRAETLSISTYWVHPATLLSLPRLQLAWMVASPAALIVALTGFVAVVRRVTLSPAAIRYEARLAKIALMASAPCLGVAAWWVITSHAGPVNVYQAGSLDLLLIACMAAALVVVLVATRHLRPVRATSR
jgi:hypothetical protein